MYNGVVLFRLKSTVDLSREVRENLCNDFKSVVGIDNYNVCVIYGSKDIIEFGVKDVSEISQSNIFYLILFSDLLTTRFSGDNYTIEYPYDWSVQRHEKIFTDDPYANSVYKLNTDYMAVVTERGVFHISLTVDLLPIGGSERFKRMVNIVGASPFFLRHLPKCWKTYLLTNGFTNSDYCNHMELLMKIKDEYLQNPWIEYWLEEFSNVLNDDYVFRRINCYYYVYHKKNREFDAKDYFYTRGLYRLLKMRLTDENVIWCREPENIRICEVPILITKITLYNHTINPKYVFMIPDALFVMYQYEFKTIADSETYDCFWESVLNDLNKKSKEPFYNRVSRFSRDAYTYKRSASCRKSEKKMMIDALNHKEEMTYHKQQVEKLTQHISDELETMNKSSEFVKRFPIIDPSEFLVVACKKYTNDDNAITKKTWREFRDTGLLWFINSILHVFGWAIGLSPDPKNPDADFIASINRTKYRGFPETSNTEGYQKVSKYLKDNIDELVKEANED